MSGRGRICFYAEYLFPLLGAGEHVEFAGGAETQQVKLAHGLSARGFDVSVVTCDFGQPARLTVDGLEVLRAFRPGSGAPVIRYFHPRLTGAMRALHEADADLYYVNGSGTPAGVTHAVARARRSAFALHIASDYDVLASLPYLSQPQDRWWYRRALRGADVRLAQTRAQQRSLELEFGVSSEVLPNLVELPAGTVDPGRASTVVWLGTYKSLKRPGWFTDLAREFPERSFVMAGVIPPPPLTEDEWHRAQEAARRTPNLSVQGFMNHAEIGKLFSHAALLVHTSPIEGFSNVLLEAWSHGLPSVSAVNPDGVVEREGLGAVADDYHQLVREVGRLLNDDEARRSAGRRARAYAERVHTPQRVIEQFASIVDRAIERKHARRTSRAASPPE